MVRLVRILFLHINKNPVLTCKGMPGWKAFVEPIFRCIDPTLVPEVPLYGSSDQDPIITLGSSRILTSSHDLATAIQRLTILLSSHPNPALTKRLLRPLLLPLWALGSWPTGNDKTESRYRLRSRNLLKSLIQLTTNIAASKEMTQTSIGVVPEILSNILFKGRLNSENVSWAYGVDFEGNGIQVQEVSASKSENSTVHELERIDGCVATFVALLGSIPDLAPEISKLFLQLFKKWISNSKPESPSILTRLDAVDELGTFQKKLIEVKIMQKLIDVFPDKLVESSSQLLEVASEVLSDFTKLSSSNEDTAAVALSLLNIVLTSPSFRSTPQTEDVLSSIQSSLKDIGRSTSEVSTTAKNLFLLLKFRSMVEEPDLVQPTSATDQQQEDRKSYNLAISYLTTIDSPPPVRAQGLELISGLIKANSSILDIPSLLVLLSSLLQDDEEYIYLCAVKTLIQLSDKHPKTVLKDLIDRYVDPQEEAELDQRLRIGEALLQVIQNRYLAFTGEISKLICEGLLFIAGRRGYRQKAEQAQERKKNLKRKQNREAEEAWEGEVPQLDEVLEMEAKEEEKFAARVIGGWESRRGTEDIRIRSSALAILGSAIEANVAGIASPILSTTIDLCIHILTLEPEEEKGILRRSAILAFMSFVRALDTAREKGEKLGFGFVGQSLEDVQRILGYVEGSDNDGLVRQHAKDVVESLQAWQMNILSSSFRDQTGGIQELAGLSVNPNVVQDSEGRMRPRIEEVE